MRACFLVFFLMGLQPPNCGVPKLTSAHCLAVDRLFLATLADTQQAQVMQQEQQRLQGHEAAKQQASAAAAAQAAVQAAVQPQHQQQQQQQQQQQAMGSFDPRPGHPGMQ